jgi:hypothetical protein
MKTLLANGQWSIGEPLRGGPDRGMYRASGTPPALVTVGAPQTRPRTELAYSSAGVAQFLAITDVTIEGVGYTALVEAEPGGQPLTERAPANPKLVARELVEIVGRANAAGHVLVGIRPELVYSDGAHCTGLAPRAEPFLAGASERSYGIPPCFDNFYLSPETLALGPETVASDVFSLCATLVFLFHNQPPFGGHTIIERVQAAMQGITHVQGIDPTIRRGLHPDPGERPTIDAIIASLS